jgi:RNA-directed DNA polymerase
MDDIQLTQRSFGVKAQHQPQHRFSDLYHLLYRADWIEYALDAVLSNTGSRTAGVDGITRKELANEKFRQQFLTELRNDLRAGTYRPQPARRHWIPKASGGQRGLGIPTLRDRVVQMLLKMLLEPIFESDFLDCSHGFRPGRRTMDCIAECYSHITRLHKYFWIVEGDIRKCFDRINHPILLRLLERRVADRRVVGLIERFLRAGLMEDGLFGPTPEGTPQGAIISPLLANVYLHELDRWWWERMGQLPLNEKRKRRYHGRANYRLVRYADDFILLCNGTKEQAVALRGEVEQFLREHLHLELNREKTHVTHASEGFDFLGFHVQYLEPSDNKPWLRVIPAADNVHRFKEKVRQITSRRQVFDTPYNKVLALNRVLRGWIGYYRHVSAKRIATKLDWWVGQRLVGWLEDKHKSGYRRVQAQYELQETKHRKNYGVRNPQGGITFRFLMADVPLRPYRRLKRPNPYLGDKPCQTQPNTTAQTPFEPNTWLGQNSNSEWLELRQQVLERDGYCCRECGNAEDLDVHHIQARHNGGQDEPANLVTLCRVCHTKTVSYGVKRPKRSADDGAG